MAAVLGLADCSQAVGSAAQAGRQAAAVPPGQPAPAPVLTYYLDQTYTAVGQEVSEKTAYLGLLKMCQGSKLHTTPLSEADVEKLATARVRTWQRPGHSVVQRDTWRLAPSSEPPDVCAFGGITEETIREVRVPPQTLYVIDLTKGTVHVQTQAGPPTSLNPPITDAQVKAAAAADVAQRRGMEMVADSHFLGQPCAVWKFYKTDGGLAYTECGWTGGFANGIPPLAIVLWRKPATTGEPWDGHEIKTTAFLIGHLPPGSDAVFKVPGKAGPAATAGAKP